MNRLLAFLAALLIAAPAFAQTGSPAPPASPLGIVGPNTANVFVGIGTGNTTLTTNENSGFGAFALPAIAGGINNDAFGWNSLNTLVNGADNTAFGNATLAAVVNGNSSSAFGDGAGNAYTGSALTAVGAASSFNNQTGTNDTSIGYFASYTNVSGQFQTCGGFEACYFGAGTSANNNTGWGYQALYNATQGGNTAVGSLALNEASPGQVLDSVAVGYDTLAGGTTAQNVVAIGYQVANTLTTGQHDVLIGTSNAVQGTSNTSSNEINIEGLLFYNTNSTAAPAVSSCGSTPSIDSHANNRSGTVTVGSGTVASCTVTFAGTGYSTWNHCRVTPHSTLATEGYSYTLTTITFTATSITSAVFDYDCDGY